MIFIPERESPLTAPSFAATLLRAIPRAYAVLFFSGNIRFGWWLLAVSLLAPTIGLCGLITLILAAALAWALGYDRVLLRTGFSLFNPLLIGLTVGFLHHCHDFPLATLALLLSAAAVGGFFLSNALSTWVFAHTGLSSHSIPSVIGAYALYLASHALFGPAIPPPHAPMAWLDLPWLPPLWQGLFQAFGSMAFQAQALPGILVFIGLACTSPLTTLVATASYAVGAAILWQLGVSPEMIGSIGGYNFLLVGIALGASYFITSGASLALAFLGCTLTAIVGIGINHALQYFSLPPSALPYNLVLLTLLYALGQRSKAGALIPSPAPGSLPEAAARRVLINNARFPDIAKPALSLPFSGPRLITQGFAGPLTHRGKWQHALDFEAEKHGIKHTDKGEALTDYYLYDTPVLAPRSGVIAYVENAIPDNAPGQNNLDKNWGNCVMLYADAGYYVLLSHLKPDSISAPIGKRISKGDELGKCGNSGRSPIPHLHLQIQATGWFGAPTRPFVLKHYIETSADGGPLYHTSGVPESGTTIAPATANATLTEMLSGLLPGDYRYRLTADADKSWEETIKLDFDEYGRYRLRSQRHGAELIAFISDGVFYTTDYTGPGDSVLALIAIGLARVPFIAEGSAAWFDGTSSVPFASGFKRWALDLVEPFFGPFMLHYRYRLEAEHGGGYAIHATSLDHAHPTAPKTLTCGIQARRGVLRIEARTHNDRLLRAVQIDYQRKL